MKKFFVIAAFFLVFPLFSFAQKDSASFIFERDLFRGREGEDIRKLQKFFAQDKEVYPEGLITGYFGALTEKAVQRFQEKYTIVSAGTHNTTGYGRIGPKTRAKLNELFAKTTVSPEPQQESQKKQPPVEEKSAIGVAEPKPAPLSDNATSATSTKLISPPKPTPNIKFGTGTAVTNSVFGFGAGAIHYKELGRLGESGSFYLGSAGGGRTSPSLFVANVTSPKKSSCDPYDESPLGSPVGPRTICEFTDAANYTFSDKEELVRFHEKTSSCYDGIVLFRQNGLYGGIEPEDITKSGDLAYRYWYDASGGSDFSSWCLAARGNLPRLGKAGVSLALASVLDSLADVLDKIQREIKKLSR